MVVFYCELDLGCQEAMHLPTPGVLCMSIITGVLDIRSRSSPCSYGSIIMFSRPFTLAILLFVARVDSINIREVKVACSDYKFARDSFRPSILELNTFL